MSDWALYVIYCRARTVVKIVFYSLAVYLYSLAVYAIFTAVDIPALWWTPIVYGVLGLMCQNQARNASIKKRCVREMYLLMLDAARGEGPSYAD